MMMQKTLFFVGFLHHHHRLSNHPPEPSNGDSVPVWNAAPPRWMRKSEIKLQLYGWSASWEEGHRMSGDMRTSNTPVHRWLNRHAALWLILTERVAHRFTGVIYRLKNSWCMLCGASKDHTFTDNKSWLWHEQIIFLLWKKTLKGCVMNFI